MRTAQDIVNAEVYMCLSSLVSTLAGGYGAEMGFRPPLPQVETPTRP